MQRLKSFYIKSIVPKLMTECNYNTLSQVPKVKKVIINRGINSLSQNSKLLNSLSEEFNLISCQKPVFTSAKKAISGFKVKENMVVGMFVTLRGDRMYAFLDRLINLSFPRIRDFQGFSRKGFDGLGNYTLGLTEQLIFPEIEFDKVVKLDGMTITIVTSSTSDKEAYALLKEFGMPFN